MSGPRPRSGGALRSGGCALLAAFLCAYGDGRAPADALPRVLLIGEPAGLLDGRTFASDDLGDTWERVPNPATNAASGPTFALFGFVDRDLGFSAGTDGALRTTDGGRSWQARTGRFPLPEEGSIAALGFVDALRGMALGSAREPVAGPPGSTRSIALFLYTADGGESWASARTDRTPVPGAVEDLCTTPGGIAFALGSQIISRVPRPPVLATSADAGRSWRGLLDGEIASRPPRRIACAGERGVWVSSPGRLLQSSDAGDSWSDRTAALPPESRPLDVADLEFTSGRHGVLLSGTQEGLQRLLVTHDGGGSWESVALPGPISTIVPIDEQDGFAFGSTVPGDFYRTRDGGRSWSRLALPPGVDFVDRIRLAPPAGAPAARPGARERH